MNPRHYIAVHCDGKRRLCLLTDHGYHALPEGTSVPAGSFAMSDAGNGTCIPGMNCDGDLVSLKHIPKTRGMVTAHLGGGQYLVSHVVGHDQLVKAK
jgi:hypothetical protein